MTDDSAGWVTLAERLADQLDAQGTLRDPAWRSALTSVPRHALVPSFYRQNADASWREITDVDPEYLPAVYSDQPLVTSVSARSPGMGEPRSSSSQPGLMIRMLEALRLRDDHRVLEVGTGTGYNAALLAHRLGDSRVHSVDVDPDLIDLAGHRLGGLGRQPRLAALDGAHGWADHAPYDRIIATCSAPAVPDEWAAQLVDGGQVLVDIKIAPSAGNLALLTRRADRLSGSFLPGWAGFMTMRAPGDHHHPDRVGPTDRPGRARTTAISPQPWHNLVVWFLACFALPPGVHHGVTLDPESRRPTATFLTSPDGSWCEVGHGDAGSLPVREYGPTPLWHHVEEADQLWHATGCPTWERFGLTVTAERQHVWLDHPDGVHRWPLRAAGRTRR